MVPTERLVEALTLCVFCSVDDQETYDGLTLMGSGRRAPRCTWHILEERFSCVYLHMVLRQHAGLAMQSFKRLWTGFFFSWCCGISLTCVRR